MLRNGEAVLLWWLIALVLVLIFAVPCCLKLWG
jgi:uncharacterized membrane protein